MPFLVRRPHSDAVGVDTTEVGAHHEVGGQLGDVGGPAPPLEDGDDEGFEAS